MRLEDRTRDSVNMSGMKQSDTIGQLESMLVALVLTKACKETETGRQTHRQTETGGKVGGRNQRRGEHTTQQSRITTSRDSEIVSISNLLQKRGRACLYYASVVVVVVVVVLLLACHKPQHILINPLSTRIFIVMQIASVHYI